MKRISSWLIPVWALGISQVLGSAFIEQYTPSVDGSVDSKYTLLTESEFANTPGGQTGASDLTGEGSGQHRWNNIGSSDEDLGSARGDIQSIYATWDRNNLYLAVVGPNLYLNDFEGGAYDGDQGDLFIAIDTALGRSVEASGSLASDEGWGSDTGTGGDTGFGGGAANTGARAVDFEGWTPDYVVAVQYVDNGGGGGGYAEIVDLSVDSTFSGEGQGMANGGFDWNSDLLNTVEFQIPWELLGFTGDFDPSIVGDDIGTIRLSAYTTANFSGFDTFDQGPGIGQGTLYETLGDAFGDDDSSGQLGANDGSTSGIPGSNFVSSTPSSFVGQADQIDTIGGYVTFNVGAIPEPQTFTMALFGLLCLRFFRRQATRK